MIEPTWKVPHDQIPLLWREWLLHAGSFMQRLLQHGVQDARIEVLSEDWQEPALEEKQLLGLDLHASALVREVLILNANNYWMFARTVIPRNLLAKQPQLGNLNNRSLGSLLFKDPTLQRSEFAIAHLQAADSWHAKVSEAVQKPMPNLWARRSLFTLQGESLFLTEVFLPDIAKL